MGKGVNYAGAFVRKDTAVQQLPEKPLALGANFFREIARRIESIYPREVETEAEPLITVSKPLINSPGLIIDGQRLTLDVCIDGNPGKIEVIGRIVEEEQT